MKTFSDDSARRGEIRPGELWYDTTGHVINAHGAGVMYDRGTYWWYGEHKVYGAEGNRSHVGVHVYSSTDLVNWDDRGIALAVEGDGSDLCDGCVLERPKVIFCPKTGLYSMFFHLELKGHGYDAARVGIATADRPEGPFRFVRSLRPNGQMSRDMTLFVDDDGKAYHIFASEDNRTTHIDELTDDFLDYTGRSVRVAVDHSTEAHAVVKAHGFYWLMGSGCTGWSPNKARLYRAETVTGPWTLLGNPCRGVDPHTRLGPELTWGCQSTFFLPVAGRPGEVIALFDRWNPTNHEESRYAWLPVTFEGDRLWIDWKVAWAPRTARAVPSEAASFEAFDLREAVCVPRADVVALRGVSPAVWKGAFFAEAEAAGYAVVRGDESRAFYRARVKVPSEANVFEPPEDWGNRMPLLYRPDCVALLASGVEFFHLRLHPKHGVTWAVFEDRRCGRRFFAFSAEFPALRGAEGETILELDAVALCETFARAKARWGEMPAIGGGASADCPEMAYVREILEARGCAIVSAGTKERD